jgi:predicted DNA-binding transcriptional regulator AlpA
MAIRARNAADLASLPPDALLRIADVIAITGWSRATIGRRVANRMLPAGRRLPSADPSRAPRYWLAGEVREVLRALAGAPSTSVPAPYLPLRSTGVEVAS